MFLLPGESLAKYSSRSASDDSEHVEPVDRSRTIRTRRRAEIAEEALTEERFEAGQIDAASNEESPSEEARARADPLAARCCGEPSGMIGAARAVDQLRRSRGGRVPGFGLLHDSSD